MSVEDDKELLEAAIEKADERDDEVASAAFRSMLDRRRRGYFTMGNLTPKQRAWAEATIAGRRYEPDPEYLNLVSEGKVPRGREVEILVRDKPLRPPSRKASQ